MRWRSSALAAFCLPPTSPWLEMSVSMPTSWCPCCRRSSGQRRHTCWRWSWLVWVWFRWTATETHRHWWDTPLNILLTYWHVGDLIITGLSVSTGGQCPWVKVQKPHRDCGRLWQARRGCRRALQGGIWLCWSWHDHTQTSGGEPQTTSV